MVADPRTFATQPTALELTLIERLAVLDRRVDVQAYDDARVMAVAVYHKYLSRGDATAKGLPHMRFMREVDTSIPDLALRGQLRETLNAEWRDGVHIGKK